jgi:hypothetical protein
VNRTSSDQTRAFRSCHHSATFGKPVVDGKGVPSPQQLPSPLATVLSLSTTLSFLSSRLPRRAVGAKPTCPGVPWRDLRCAIRVPQIYRSTTTIPLSSLHG